MPDCQELDTIELRRELRSSLGEWLTNNQNEIDNNTAKYMLHLMETGIKIPAPSLVQEYCNDEAYNHVKEELEKYGDRRALHALLPAVVSFAIRYDNTSCHEILFRQYHALNLPKLESGFLSMMYSVSEEDRDRICEILRQGQEDQIGLHYLIKRRVVALSNELGIQLEKLISVSLLPNSIIKGIRDFAGMPIYPDHKYVSKKDIKRGMISWTVLTRMVYMLCINYDVSADYFLLQDYSSFVHAVDGNSMTPYRRELLSLFLCASPLAQEKAMQELLAKYVAKAIS